MSNKGPCSIFAVETKVASKDGSRKNAYHSFLLLVQGDSQENMSPLQELHFVHSERSAADGQKEEFLQKALCLKAITKPANRDYSEMTFERFATGNREEMIAQWNKMTEIGASISSVRIRFTENAGRDAVNCRTGTKAVLKALGYKFKPLEKEAYSGTKVCVLNRIDDVIVDPTPKFFSREEMRDIRQNFLMQMAL